jgi:hypothetical protein
MSEMGRHPPKLEPNQASPLTSLQMVREEASKSSPDIDTNQYLIFHPFSYMRQSIRCV